MLGVAQGGGGWSGHRLQGVFDATTELEDGQQQQPDRTGAMAARGAALDRI
jgi:hypothetical protein